MEPQEKRFFKLYFVVFTNVLMATGNIPLMILAYIIRNTSNHNEFNHTAKEVAATVGCSPRTVKRMFDLLESCDFMFNIPGTQRYMINPECYIRGSYKRFGMLRKQYKAYVEGKKINGFFE